MHKTYLYIEFGPYSGDPHILATISKVSVTLAYDFAKATIFAQIQKLSMNSAAYTFAIIEATLATTHFA
jgi:hypothetical protein